MKPQFLYRLLILLSLSLIYNFSGAQNLLAPGTEWHYSHRVYGGPDITYNRCFIEGDTIINDQACLIYVQERRNCNGRPLRNYISKQEDKIYFYDQDESIFKLLYDFGLSPGDTMTLDLGKHYWDNESRTLYLKVDSITQFQHENHILKKLYVRYGRKHDGHITFSEEDHVKKTIIEDIGSTINFFHFEDTTGFCDDAGTIALRCFNSPGEAFVQFTDVDCIYTSVDNVNSDHKVDIFPNPISNILYIRTENINRGYTIIIMDTAGNHVYQQDEVLDRFHQLKLQNFATGLYYLIITSSNDQYSSVKKFYKQ